LNSRYDPYSGHPEFVPPGKSTKRTNQRHQHQGAIQSPKRSIAYAAQTVQPPPVPAAAAAVKTPSATGTRPPPISLKRVPSKSTNNSRLETLLSLQQFLDSSPRIDRQADVDTRELRTPEPPKSVKSSAASPDPSFTTLKPASAGQRTATSFIDSSDEDDHIENDQIDNTPGTSVQSATTARVILSKHDVPAEQSVKPPMTEHAGKLRLDLTQSLPSTPESDVAVSETQLPRPSHPQSDHIHDRQAPEDINDPFGTLPLQRHSPLRRTRTRDKRRSLGWQYSSLGETQDEKSDPYERPVTKSAESLPLEPSFSDNGEDDQDFDENDEPLMNIHVHRRYYRSVDDNVPEEETRPQMTAATSWNNRRAAVRTPTPVPWYSPGRDTDERPTTPKNENDSEEFSETDNLADWHPQSVLDSIYPMQNFGVPSIVRSPVKRTRARMPQYRHDGVTPSTPKLPKFSGSRSIQRHKQTRSQQPPLTCIVEAKPQDETPSDTPWDFPIVDSTGSGLFGAEAFMRLSSENDTGSESELETRVNDAGSEAYTVPGDQGSATPGSARTPAKPISHNIIHRRLGSPISIRSPRTNATNPRTSHKFSSSIDLEHEEYEEDDEDEEEASASPPPDITRHRRPAEDQNDGLQSLIHALKAGPTVNHVGGQAPAKTQLTGIDRFEEMLRRADEEERRRKRQTKSKMAGVLGRLLKR